MQTQANNYSGLDDAPDLIYAVGDVHGCSLVLNRLLDMVIKDSTASSASRRPRLVMLGDLVDRGPDSRGVIDTLLSSWFAESFDATVLRGNHEDMLNESLDYALNATHWLYKAGGANTLASYGLDVRTRQTKEIMDCFNQILPVEHREFLRTRPFSVSEDGLFLCHAGVDPFCSLGKQSPMDLMWIRKPFLSYPRKFGALVVHGHTTTKDLQVEVHHNRVAVDTGCGFPNGRLSAAVFKNGQVLRVLTAY